MELSGATRTARSQAALISACRRMTAVRSACISRDSKASEKRAQRAWAQWLSSTLGSGSASYLKP